MVYIVCVKNYGYLAFSRRYLGFRDAIYQLTRRFVDFKLRHSPTKPVRFGLRSVRPPPSITKAIGVGGLSKVFTRLVIPRFPKRDYRVLLKDMISAPYTSPIFFFYGRAASGYCSIRTSSEPSSRKRLAIIRDLFNRLIGTSSQMGEFSFNDISVFSQRCDNPNSSTRPGRQRASLAGPHNGPPVLYRSKLTPTFTHNPRARLPSRIPGLCPPRKRAWGRRDPPPLSTRLALPLWNPPFGGGRQRTLRGECVAVLWRSSELASPCAVSHAFHRIGQSVLGSLLRPFGASFSPTTPRLCVGGSLLNPGRSFGEYVAHLPKARQLLDIPTWRRDSSVSEVAQRLRKAQDIISKSPQLRHPP